MLRQCCNHRRRLPASRADISCVVAIKSGSELWKAYEPHLTDDPLHTGYLLLPRLLPANSFLHLAVRLPNYVTLKNNHDFRICPLQCFPNSERLHHDNIHICRASAVSLRHSTLDYVRIGWKLGITNSSMTGSSDTLAFHDGHGPVVLTPKLDVEAPRHRCTSIQGFSYRLRRVTSYLRICTTTRALPIFFYFFSPFHTHLRSPNMWLL